MSDVRFDFKRYTETFADRVGWLLGIRCRAVARDTVRIDTTTLRNSIMLEKVGEFEHEVSANTEYAAAQEFGRPDLPRYGFTPYMRPAAKQALQELPEITKQAADLAARDSR